ncbi:hypothetical protein N2152v2_006112 [Parachlorella kessleri]
MSDSELKKLKPVTAYAMILCAHANCRVLFKRFNELVESEAGKGDDKLVEMLAHHIGLHTRMHNQCIQDVEMALVKQLPKGGTLAQKMQKQVLVLEEGLENLEKTKKHLDNEEFVELMQKMEKDCEELMDQEETVLEQLTKEVDEDALVKAADKMESVKLSLTVQQLLPEKMAYA